MSSFHSAGFKYELTGRRTDDGSGWRKFFGENPVGHFWGRPIVRITEGFTFKLGNYNAPFYAHTIPAGFECDLGTAPGPLKLIVAGLVRLKLIKENLDMVSTLHDDMWGKADQAETLADAWACYSVADTVFLQANLVRGQPLWYSLIVYLVVRLAGALKLLGRLLRK